METVLRRTSVIWLVTTAAARTNERVAGILAPKHADPGNNPIRISAYYVGAIFGVSVTQKTGTVALSAVRIYGSLDAQRWPAAGDSGEALVTVNKDLAVDQSVIRYPVGLSAAVNGELPPRLLPPLLMLEYTCTGTGVFSLVFQVRATFQGTPPYGEEPDDFGG